jgi:PCFT/HCP family folate transporter-like MFS transporter 1/3
MANRTRGANFLYLNLGAAGGSLLGPLIAGLLMNRFDPWVPIALVLTTIPIVVGMLLFVPETLTINVKAEHSNNLTMKEQFIRGGNDLVRSLRILKNINILMCMVTFFFGQARFAAATSTLTQYISKNFGWTLAETSILLSPLGIVTIAAMGSLPKISEMMVSRFGFTSFSKDLYLAKLSLLLLTTSALIRGMSSSIGPFLVGQVISSFGAAEQALVRATMSAFVSPSYTSRLFALVETVGVLGAPLGGPVMAWCFDRGMKWEGAWTGLPWYYLALTCALPWLALVFVRAPRKRWDGEEVVGDDEDDLRPNNPVRLD